MAIHFETSFIATWKVIKVTPVATRLIPGWLGRNNTERERELVSVSSRLLWPFLQPTERSELELLEWTKHTPLTLEITRCRLIISYCSFKRYIVRKRKNILNSNSLLLPNTVVLHLQEELRKKMANCVTYFGRVELPRSWSWKINFRIRFKLLFFFFWFSDAYDSCRGSKYEMNSGIFNFNYILSSSSYSQR